MRPVEVDEIFRITDDCIADRLQAIELASRGLVRDDLQLSGAALDLDRNPSLEHRVEHLVYVSPAASMP